MSLTLILLLPFLGSICAAVLPSNARNAEAWLAGAFALASAALLIALYPQVTDGGVVRASLPWLPQRGLDLQLRMDGYAWMFAMLITGIGALVVFYARYYLSPADPVPRFFSFLLAFMGAMLGIVLSGNLIQMVVFWELTSFTSFMLIAYWYHRAEARRGAGMALTVTAAGGLCLFAAVLLIGEIVGGYDLDRVLAAGAQIRAHAWYPLVLVLVLIGAFTKSAQFPFHFWLPHAMAAPTPVSAYLHSATMVKAGVFLLARLWPVLAGTDLWFTLVCGAGLATLLLGAGAAMFQRDIKGVLAYSTISHLGLITLLLGMNSQLALVAAVFHMMNHATFKASLFMAAGIVDHETGTRDLHRLRGLGRVMPITATLAIVATAAMAGVPLLNGFLSKEMFFAETIFAGEAAWLRIGLPAVATLASLFSVTYSLRLAHRTFLGPLSQRLPRKPHDPNRWMLAPSALLVSACVLVGILPADTVGPFLASAARSLLGADVPEYSLAVWHGLTLPLVMSAVALIGGAVLYALLYRHRDGALAPPPFSRPIDARRSFDVSMVVLMRTADRLLNTLSTRRLQPQLALIVLAIVAIAGVTALQEAAPPGRLPLTPMSAAFAMLWAIGAACAIGAATQAKYHRLAALIMSGGAGLITCLTFAWFSAPDLALTQISVEVVTVVLILLGLRWLPKRLELDDPGRRTPRARLRRARDLILAIVAGAGLASLAFVIMTRPRGEGIARFFMERALPDSGGRNVVNVILVDFRGFDTLGEITVVAIVALAVFKLLRRFRPAPESMAAPPAQRIDAENGVLNDPDDVLPRGFMRVPAVLGRLLMPVAGVISVFFLLRGHNAPGGGFVGGLVMATGFIVQYMVSGTLWIESRMRVHPQYAIGIGLLCAGGAGILAWPASRNFLSNLSWHGALPLIGELHLSSTLLFDLGVYLLVVGATVLMLIALAHQSLRSQRRQVETSTTRVLPSSPGPAPWR
ncbi:MAG TPA: monovalent cation/H+ antiporter subunit A [Steroidobacteraceae bacterium]|nr:monovalent cation/H+ antiporter subunit A [Steroidobacteraceae bacterium]